MTKSDFEYSIGYAFEQFLQKLTDLASRHNVEDPEAVEAAKELLGWDVGDALEEWLVSDDY